MGERSTALESQTALESRTVLESRAVLDSRRAIEEPSLPDSWLDGSPCAGADGSRGTSRSIADAFDLAVREMAPDAVLVESAVTEPPWGGTRFGEGRRLDAG